MSEDQYVAFRAVDRPLTDEQIDFARTQSSRAEISRWSFSNEYHYGNFRGDVDALLRSGYDVHLHYANYGTRRVAMRLPHGLPFDEELWRQYCEDDEEGFGWKLDSEGTGGIIDWCPFHDAGSIEEEWEPHQYIPDCVALRVSLIQGDLRALYVIWLCTTSGDYGDWQAIEPPVPYGLAEFSGVCGNLLSFFGVDPLVLEFAAEGTPPLIKKPEDDPGNAIKTWVAKTKLAAARELLIRFMTEDPVGVKAELLAEIRDGQPSATWPSVPGTRTFQQLCEGADRLHDKAVARERKKQAEAVKRAAEKAEKERQARMVKMKADPKKWLAEASALAGARGIANYQATAEILADMREAIGGAEGEKITHTHAAHLWKKHPTLTQLKSALRKRGLIG